MSLKVSRCLPSFLLVLFAMKLSVNAQSVPCAAITRNPLVLEALLDSHSKDSDSDLQDDTIDAAQLERLQFNAIVIQPGDALYMEYRGKDFTIDADFASGERTAFDSSPKGNYQQWRKGVLPLDMFRGALINASCGCAPLPRVLIKSYFAISKSFGREGRSLSLPSSFLTENPR
jgi:hypothetical protein